MVTSMIVWWLQMRFRRRGVLFWNLLPRAQFFVPPTPTNPGPPLPVHAETIAMQNIGGATLEEVTIVLSHQPMDWQLRVTPNRPYGGEVISEGNYSIALGSLGKNEFLTISVHYYDRPPTIVQIRTKEGLVQASPMFFTRVLKNWQITTNVTLQIIGLFTVILLGITFAASVGPIVVDAMSDWIANAIGGNTD